MANKSYKSWKFKAFKVIGNRCVRCGSSENLEIDHKNWRSKSFNVSDKYASVPWSVMLQELLKCEPLCHDCHKEKTKVDRKEQAAERPEAELYFKHGTRFAVKTHKCTCDKCNVWRDADAAKRREARKKKNG